MTDIAVEKHSIWQELRDAIRGTDTDFTEAPLRRAVVLLAVPMMLEMVLESLFAVVNIFWVGKLGPAATASVGLTESLLSVVYALAMGLSIGVTALVARRIGEKHTEQAARTTGQAILLGLIVAAVLGSAGFLLAPTLLELMGGTPDVVAAGSWYARILLGGEATVILLFLNEFQRFGHVAVGQECYLAGYRIAHFLLFQVSLDFRIGECRDRNPLRP